MISGLPQDYNDVPLDDDVPFNDASTSDVTFDDDVPFDDASTSDVPFDDASASGGSGRDVPFNVALSRDAYASGRFVSFDVTSNSDSSRDDVSSNGESLASRVLGTGWRDHFQSFVRPSLRVMLVIQGCLSLDFSMELWNGHRECEKTLDNMTYNRYRVFLALLWGIYGLLLLSHLLITRHTAIDDDFIAWMKKPVYGGAFLFGFTFPFEFLHCDVPEVGSMSSVSKLQIFV